MEATIENYQGLLNRYNAVARSKNKKMGSSKLPFFTTDL
jgi:hypothetical protein